MKQGRKPLTEAQLLAKFSLDENTGCMNWTGHRYASGYGRLTIARKDWMVHRHVWTMHHGAIPSGMLVCHTCDNPACGNIEHLFLGTSQDNMTDKVVKGRQQRGEGHPRAKLSEEDVRHIRASRARQIDLAAQYGVAQNLISKIKRRRVWRHVE